jgi:pimeloyl-ACP methyl ester carboxylesterase
VIDLRRAWELHLSNDAVARFLGGSPADVPDHYREASPAEQHIRAEQVLIHGTSDEDVPYEISQRYAEQKKKSGENVQLITMKDTDHFEIVDPNSKVWAKVQDVFLLLTR